MIREPGSIRLAVGGVAAIVTVVAVVYTVVQVRAVSRETQTDRELAERRRAPERLGYFSGLNVNRQSPVHPPPAAACAPGAIELVRSAARALADGALHPEVAPDLERALEQDPSCVAAGRLLIQLRGREALQVFERSAVARADAAPADAAAQLLAAYYERAVADGVAYRRYLERASAANPDQPLLHVAWSYYWAVFASPRSLADQLRELEAEVRVSGDPASIAGLASALAEVGDDDAALGWCRRYYEAVPDAISYPLALTCAKAAIRGDASDDERSYVDRTIGASNALVSGACRHADLAAAYVDACRGTEALREADLAIAGGCEVPGLGHRRSALLTLGRYEEATVPASRYWGVTDRGNRALALALVGRRGDALRSLTESAGFDDAGTSVAGTERAEPGTQRLHVIRALVDDGPSRERLESSVACRRATGDVARLTRAASGYVNAFALPEARVRVERALALDPRSEGAWDVKTYLLSLEGRLDDAARDGEAALAAGVRGGSFLANLGWVHQQRGDCERAVVLYELARESVPLRVQNYGNLARCLELLGRDREARAAWAYVPGGPPERRVWPALVALVVAVPLTYLGVKLALIRLWPRRFGHLRFP